MRRSCKPLAFLFAALLLRSFAQGRAIANSRNIRFRGVRAAAARARGTATPPRRASVSTSAGYKGLLRGGDNKPERVFWECLPTGTPIKSLTRIKKWQEHGLVLWIVPIAACVLSFSTFPCMSRNLYRAMQWASHRTWIPENKEEVDLQTNVVTQVVNGPVITSISVLFASLVGLTISNFHKRQIDVHRSIVAEVHNFRALQSLLESPAAVLSFGSEQLEIAKALVQQHADTLFSPKYSTAAERRNAHECIESCLPALIQWRNEQALHRMERQQQQQRGRGRDNKKQNFCSATAQSIEAQLEMRVENLMKERGRRWMALQTGPFPMVHYLTLTLLALSIVVSFLVATAQAEFIFVTGLPVRVLWSVLITSFTALGVVCFDLARPFRGAYHIE